MPPKKKETEEKKKSVKKTKKKIAAKKVAPAPEVKKEPAIIETPKPRPTSPTPTPTPKPASSGKSRKSGGMGGAFLFLIVIALIAIFGVYAFQKQQTDSVVNKLSSLEGKLEQKLQDIEADFAEEIEETEMKAEEQKEQALAEATTKLYTSNSYGFSFRYPKSYEIMSVNTDVASERRERVTLVRSEVLKSIEGLDALGAFPMIKITLYKNSTGDALDTWLQDRAEFVDFPDGGEFSSALLANEEAFEYTRSYEIGYTTDSVAAESEGNVILLGNEYPTDESGYQEDFQVILDSFSF